MKQYFLCPANGTFDLNWFIHQFFALFSKQMSQRYYETVAHCNKGQLIGLLCAIGVIDVVRYSFLVTSDSGVSKVVYYHGFRSYKDLQLVAIRNTKTVALTLPQAQYVDSILIAGYNQVYA
jgi:hypothetical protein